MQRVKNYITSMGIGAFIGWAGFWALMACLVTKHYLFNPFIFGAGYYAIYAMLRSLDKTEKRESGVLEQRVMIVGIIALLYLYTFIRDSEESAHFERAYDQVCSDPYSQGEKVHSICSALRPAEHGTLSDDSND